MSDNDDLNIRPIEADPETFALIRRAKGKPTKPRQFTLPEGMLPPPRAPKPQSPAAAIRWLAVHTVDTYLKRLAEEPAQWDAVAAHIGKPVDQISRALLIEYLIEHLTRSALFHDNQSGLNKPVGKLTGGIVSPMARVP